MQTECNLNINNKNKSNINNVITNIIHMPVLAY